MFGIRRWGQLMLPVVVLLLLLGVFGCGNGEEETVDGVNGEEEEVKVNGEEEADDVGAETATGWELEVIKEDLTSDPDFDLVVDLNDNAHIIYENPDTGVIKHTYRSPDGNWEEQVVAEPGPDNSAFPAITIDKEGNLHAAFAQDKEIIYARKDNGEWEKEVVGEGDLLSSAGISLVVGEGNVHIVHPGRDGATPIIKSTSRINGEWETQMVGEGRTRYDAFLTVDDAGIPHLGYITDNEVGDLFYATLKDNTWSTEIVDEKIDPSYIGDILIDENGDPKLLYQKEVGEDETRRLKQAVGENGAWDINVIKLADETYYEDLPRDKVTGVVNSQGQFALAYSTLQRGEGLQWEEILYLERQGNDWETTVVRATEKSEDGIKKAYGPAYQLDSQDKGHFAYGMRESGGVGWDEDNLYSLKYIKEK